MASGSENKDKKAEKGKAKTEAKKVVHTYKGFPHKTAINGYCFLRFPKQMLGDLGWRAGMNVVIDKNEDDSIIVRKA